MTVTSFTREDLIAGIRAVIEKLSIAGEPGGIHIIGGAALALLYFDRRVTTDIDAQLVPEESILKVSHQVALEKGWPSDWLNSKATMFMPLFSLGLDWRNIYADGLVTISVASAKALLAMKIYASRIGRDEQDVANLLAICAIENVEECESLMDSYYPGEGLPPKALRLLTAIFERGVPHVPKMPKPPRFN